MSSLKSGNITLGLRGRKRRSPAGLYVKALPKQRRREEVGGEKAEGKGEE